MSNIICYDSDNNLLKTLYQWDSNQTITVKGATTQPAPVFHFCNRNSNVALVVTPTIVEGDLVVKVPNILLQQAEPLIVYLYKGTGIDGYRTMHTIHIPVAPRIKPNDYEYEDNIDYISLAILNSELMELLSSLTDGSMDDVAPEVIDIRTGHDGTIYATAGEAVRALGTNLTQSINTKAKKQDAIQQIQSTQIDLDDYRNGIYRFVGGLVDTGSQETDYFLLRLNNTPAQEYSEGQSSDWETFAPNSCLLLSFGNYQFFLSDLDNQIWTRLHSGSIWSEWCEIGSGGGSVVVDSVLSLTSRNPVQNRIITRVLNNKLNFETEAWSEGEEGGIIEPSISNNPEKSGYVRLEPYQEISGTIPNDDQHYYEPNAWIIYLYSRQFFISDYDNKVWVRNYDSSNSSWEQWGELVPVDNTISATSDNPIKNKVVANAISNQATIRYDSNGVIKKIVNSTNISTNDDIDPKGFSDVIVFGYGVEKILQSACQSFGSGTDGRSYKKVVLSETITEIQEYAFWNNPQLLSVTIPKNVVTIGTKAFGYNYYDNPISNFVIYGYKNTEAERYATDNNFTFIPLVDEEIDTVLSDSSYKAVANCIIKANLDSKVTDNDVLTKTNSTSYTPTADYHPATKKYVDDGLSGKANSSHTHSQYLTEHQDISGKEDKSTISTQQPQNNTLLVNTEYYIGEQATLSIAFEDLTANDKGKYIYLCFESGSTATNLTVDTSNTTDFDFAPSTDSICEIMGKWNGEIWLLISNEMTVTTNE